MVYNHQKNIIVLYIVCISVIQFSYTRFRLSDHIQIKCNEHLFFSLQCNRIVSDSICMLFRSYRSIQTLVAFLSSLVTLFIILLDITVIMISHFIPTKTSLMFEVERTQQILLPIQTSSSFFCTPHQQSTNCMLTGYVGNVYCCI